MLNRKFYKILIIFCLVFMIGLLAYIYFFDNSIPTIAEELDTGEISKRKALEDLTSIPVRDLVEEEDSFRVVDEKDNIGVEIIYNSHSSNLSYQGEYPEGGRGVNGEGQNETLNSADDGHTPRPNGHPSQEGISDDGDVFQIDFYKDYSKGIEVDLGEGRSFLMKDVSSGDFKVSSLSSAPLNSPLERSTAEQGGVLNREDSSDKLNSNGDGNTPHPSGTPLERGFVKYESKDERKKIYYGYQKDSATGERKLKKWIIYEEPEVSSSQKSKVHKVESVGYEYEEYVFENAKLHKNEDGDVEVFYWGDKEKQNELTMAEVDQSLLARAQRVLARDMGEDFMKNGEPDLIIPKPFYYDKDNNLTYLDWQISEDGHTLILEFRVEENKYPIALDPTLEFTAPGIPEASDVITGEKTSNAFGSSLSVGDLNNDGKNDLVVGAGSHNSYRGRVYIFYQDGGLGDKANMADVIIDGENSSDRFGSHLAIGDLNANGKNDLIVDAYYYNSSQGRVYIFYNDGAYPNTAGLADEIITGEAGIGYFGNSLVIGDFNSNGKIDLVIGAYGYNSSQGRAYIFYNDGIYTNLAASADEIITGEASSNFGIEFTVGDLNVDGKDDLVIGAYGYDASDDEGRVYIFYNDGTGVYVDTAATADEIITGENLSFFGYSLATGDLDADGDTDLVVGGYKYGIFDGRVYIFYNNGTGVYVDTAATADEIITGEDSADRFGFFLTVDDLNMDGKDDLIAGAYLYDITSNEGRVYVYYNDGYYTATSTLADVIITGEGTDSSFGFSFSTGDLNSDGKTDLVVGAQGYNSSQGRVYIFYSQNGQVNLNKSIVGESTSDYFGNAMTSGDFDADGDIDLAVGAYEYNTGQGRVYIFYNDYDYGDHASTADEIITGETSSQFGTSMSVGDLNSDGKEDLVVGAVNYSSYRGRSYIFYNDGSYAASAASADEIITGEASSQFGTSMSVGDLNSDGKTDLIVGAKSFSSFTGRTYIFYNDGQYPLNATSADIMITGENNGDYFGIAMIVDDFTSDGKDDLLVGAYQYNNDTGKIYFYETRDNYSWELQPQLTNDFRILNHGGAELKITGEGGGAHFGYASAIGDLNADGKNDLVISAYSLSKVYIFYNDGSYANDAASADKIIIGDGDNFGYHLAIGDLNSDGNDDLVVGDYYYDMSGQCKVYIFYNDGAYVNDAASADKIITGDSWSFFGSYILISDLDADGDNDLAVNAWGYSSSRGRVYIFYNDGSYPTVATAADEIITGVAGSGFGYSLSVGNYNLTGTSTEDLVVGAPSYDLDLGTNTNEGRIYIFYNDETGVYPYGATSSDITITGEQGGFFGGTSFVNGIVSGDINNDSRTDIIISSIGYNSSQGCVYIFYNDSVYPWGATSADIILTGETIGSYYGSSLTTGDFNNDGKEVRGVGFYGYISNKGGFFFYFLNDPVIGGGGANNSFGNSLASGDFNGDGKGDLVVGASGYNSSQGRIYIFYNDSVMTNSAGAADVVISGEASSLFGHLLETGDLNADGKTDLVVGAWLYNSIQGRVYVFYGGESYPSSAASADVKITGTSFFDYFGLLLKTGDLNADGKIDLLVARTDSANIIYIFYNDGTYPASSASADQIVLGEPSGRFGSSVVIGDINANGKEDLVISNSYYNSNLGRIYIFYNDGTGEYPYGATSSDVTITGSFLSEQFGISLQKGDLNSDGKTDLIVGARAYNSNQGRTYVFYNDGSYPDLSSGADIKLTGENTGDYFGASILTEDMNLDGINDLIVGAYGYNSSQGRVYIYTNETRAVDGFKKGEIRGNASFKGDVIIR